MRSPANRRTARRTSAAGTVVTFSLTSGACAAAGSRRAVHACDDRDGTVPYRAVEAEDAAHHLLVDLQHAHAFALVTGVVSATAKIGAASHDGNHSRVGVMARVVDQRAQAIEHIHGERIAGIGTIQIDASYAFVLRY